MRDRVRGRLAGMMALVYAVQGAWWPLLAVHLDDLGIDGRGRGWIFATMAMAALATPLGAGQLADRIWSAERLLALIYAIGAGLLAILAAGWVTGFGPLLVIFLVYWLVTAPALSLSSSLALRNLERPSTQFGGVRLWGTIGWMGAGWLVTLATTSRGPGRGVFEAFAVAAGLSLILAVYATRLPHTPPLAGGRRGIDPGDVRELARKPAVATLLITSFGISLTTPFVYQAVPAYLPTLGLPKHWIASAMTLGQVLEIAALATLPRVWNRLGPKRTLALGIGAWIVYHGVLAWRPPLALALAVLPLNGLAIAWFHVAGPIFLDSQAPPDRRASAQGLYLLATTGLGCLLGHVLAGEVVGRAGGVTAAVFAVPAALDALILAAFLAGFRATSPAVSARIANKQHARAFFRIFAASSRANR